MSAVREPVVRPGLAALVAVAAAASLGGGRYPLYVDVMVYLNIALFAWIGVREVIYKARFRREDRAATEQGGTP
ncbi:hypothetical protein [Streptomyces sp. NPDC056491]|uniref:hypothetical protein n=1 Tax=Streptomyces sp. NPDC056491 TaxID=3345837 RepID=UPI0036830212